MAAQAQTSKNSQQRWNGRQIADRRLRLKDIIETAGILEGCIDLWCLHDIFLTPEQKRDGETILGVWLARNQHNPRHILMRFLTVDETWIRHYTAGTKKQSKQSTFPSELTPRKAKGHGQPLSGFPGCDPDRLSAEGKDDHGEILQRFFDPIRCSSEGEALSFAPRCVQIESLALPISLSSSMTSSPNLAPSVFFLFPNMRKSLVGKKNCLKWEGHRCYCWLFCRPRNILLFQPLEKIGTRLKKCIGLWRYCIEK